MTKLTRQQHFIAAALAGGLTLTSAHAQTPNRVETHIGTLDFERGYPTPETARKLYDKRLRRFVHAPGPFATSRAHA